MRQMLQLSVWACANQMVLLLMPYSGRERIHAASSSLLRGLFHVLFFPRVRLRHCWPTPHASPCMLALRRLQGMPTFVVCDVDSSGYSIGSSGLDTIRQQA